MTQKRHVGILLILLALGLFGSLRSAQGQGLIYQMPRVVFLNTDGTLLVGGKLCSYQAGTTTPLSTYSDSGLSVPNTNPLVTNSSGILTSSSTAVTVYLSAQSYKFVLLTAGSDNTCSTGSTLWTADNIPGGYAASAIIAGTLNTARLGSGSANSTTFLRGDSTWATTWSTVTTTSTGNQTGAWITLTGNTVIRANNATLLTIQGIPAGFDGQLVQVVSIGAGQVDLANQSGSESTAANRLINYATSGNTSLAAGVGTAMFVYDGTTSRWRLVAHEQGDFIEYGASATVTGFSAFTAQLARYKLRGRELQFILDIAGTSNATTLTFNLPSTFTTNASLTQQQGLVKGLDSGAAANAEYSIGVGASTVSMFKDAAGTAWTNSGTKQVSGSFVLQIQ